MLPRRFCAIALLSTFALTGAVSQVDAQTTFARSVKTGVSGTDSWNTSGEWTFPDGQSVSGIPGAMDEVYIGDRDQPGLIGSADGDVEVTLSANGFAANLFLGSTTNPDSGLVTVFGSGNLDVSGTTSILAGNLAVAGAFSSSDLTMSGGTLFSQTGGTVNVSDVLTVGGDYQLTGGTLTTQELVITGSGSLTHNGGAVNVTDVVTIGDVYELASGTLTAKELVMTGSGTLNRTFGNFDIEQLSFNNAGTIEILANDIISDSISLTSGASLIFTQNDTLGLDKGLLLNSLDIDGSSTFEINFDPATPLNTDDGDWALGLIGDQETKLQAFIDSGQIFTTQFDNSTIADPLELGVYYDSVADVTYLTAVPEPSSLVGLALLAGIAGLRRKRKS